MFVILLLVATKSILKCKYRHKKKLSNLIPGYKVNLNRFSHDPNKVNFNFSSCLNRRREKLLCKGLRFCIPPKRFRMLTFLQNLNCYTGSL